MTFPSFPSPLTTQLTLYLRFFPRLFEWNVLFFFFFLFFFLMFVCFCFVSDVWWWHRWIRLITLLTWFVGGITLCLIALRSLGSSGWPRSLQRLVPLTLPRIITSIGSVWFPCIVVTRVVSMLRIQHQCLMSKTVFFFITSNSLLFLSYQSKHFVNAKCQPNRFVHTAWFHT